MIPESQIVDTTFTTTAKQRFVQQRDRFIDRLKELRRLYPYRFWMVAMSLCVIVFYLSFATVQAATFDHTENFLYLEAAKERLADTPLSQREKTARTFRKNVEDMRCRRVSDEFQNDCSTFKKTAQRYAVSIEFLAREQAIQAEAASEERDRLEKENHEKSIRDKAFQTDIDEFNSFRDSSLAIYDQTSSQSAMAELVSDTERDYSPTQNEKKVELINNAAKVFIPIMNQRRQAVNFECERTSVAQQDLCLKLIEQLEYSEKIIDMYFNSAEEFRFSSFNLSENNYKEIGKAFSVPRDGVQLILNS